MCRPQAPWGQCSLSCKTRNRWTPTICYGKVEGSPPSPMAWGVKTSSSRNQNPRLMSHTDSGVELILPRWYKGYSRQKYKNYFQTSKLVLEGAPSQPRITKTPMDITPSEDGLTIKKYRSLMKWKGKSTDAIIKNYLGQPKKGSFLNVTFLKKLGYLKVTFLKIREARDIL